MSGWTRRHLLVGAAAVGAAVLAGCSGNQSNSDGSDSGFVSGDGSWNEYPPAERVGPVELVGTSMEGDPLDLADWRGAPVVLNFWYAACPPCRKEAPDLAAIATEREADGVHVLGVNHIDEPATALAFQRTFAIPYPSLYDSSAEGVAALQGLVPLQAMPSTVVLDGDGMVAARIIGIADKSTLDAMLDTVLAEA